MIMIMMNKRSINEMKIIDDDRLLRLRSIYLGPKNWLNHVFFSIFISVLSVIVNDRMALLISLNWELISFKRVSILSFSSACLLADSIRLTLEFGWLFDESVRYLSVVLLTWTRISESLPSMNARLSVSFVIKFWVFLYQKGQWGYLAHQHEYLSIQQASF